MALMLSRKKSGSSSNPDRVAYSGIYGTNLPRGIYTINGVDTTFTLDNTVAPADLFCSIAQSQTSVTYTKAGKYMETVIGSTSTTQIVDRAVNDVLTISPSSNGFGVSIVKLS